MVWKLLRRNISVWQIAGYALATLVGLVVVAAAVQLYLDLAPALNPTASPAQRLVISKEVSVKDTFRGSPPSFTATELADLAAQPWAADVAPLRAADFAVYAGVDLGGRAMGTQLFFEAVPARFAPVDSAVWTFHPDRPEIPVVIPRDYLALYNFGFAASGGMPAMSEAMLSAVPLSVTVSGRGQSATLPARIVGYSDWLNTIAVPSDFLAWAHPRFGSDADRAPSRVVVEVSEPGHPDIDAYLAAHNYSRSGVRTDLARASRTLAVATSAIAAVGAVITLLALGILLLSLYLLVQKNRRAISALLLLGYTPRAVARCYIRLVLAVNAAVLLLAVGALLAVRPLWEHPLDAFGIGAASPWVSICTATLIIIVITALNAAVLTRLTRRCFRYKCQIVKSSNRQIVVTTK